MIVRTVTRRRLGDDLGDLEYWRSRPAAERVRHVQSLRAENYGWAVGAGPDFSEFHRVLRRA